MRERKQADRAKRRERWVEIQGREKKEGEEKVIGENERERGKKNREGKAINQRCGD